jgi:AraC-like DNA-binding protein
MTIRTSEQDWAIWEAESAGLLEYPDPDDPQDVVLPQPTWLAQGNVRDIELRDGLSIQIDHFQMCDRCEDISSESEGWIQFHCHLSGDHQDALTEVGNLEYALYGSGLLPKQTMVCSGQIPIWEVTIEMSPDVLVNFAGHQGALPTELQHLIRPSTQVAYARVAKLSPTLQQVLLQILRCPYRGLTKRMFLESKALEIAALMLEQERDFQQGRQSPMALKPDTIERLYQAREILLENLEQPPTLSKLARQAGLNEKALKQGFRQVFGQTVFSYLHEYRMEQARQLLMVGDLRVGEVMQQIGFHDRRYFAGAFRKRFGVTPRDYQRVNAEKSF